MVEIRLREAKDLLCTAKRMAAIFRHSVEQLHVEIDRGNTILEGDAFPQQEKSDSESGESSADSGSSVGEEEGSVSDGGPAKRRR